MNSDYSNGFLIWLKPPLKPPDMYNGTFPCVSKLLLPPKGYTLGTAFLGSSNVPSSARKCVKKRVSKNYSTLPCVLIYMVGDFSSFLASQRKLKRWRLALELFGFSCKMAAIGCRARGGDMIQQVIARLYQQKDNIVVEDAQESSITDANPNDEDAQQSSITDDQVIANPNNENEVLEEGEILHDDDSSANPNLQNSWTFWFNPSAKSKKAAWGSSVITTYTFATVEEFWSILHPSKLAVGADFYCFKHNIEPNWEDPICANGRKWTMTFPRGKSDTSWIYTLLRMIGKQFDHGDYICGAVVNVRNRREKIALWTKNAANIAAQVSIGKQWKEFLGYKDTISFTFHEDAKKHGRAAKIIYVI